MIDPQPYKNPGLNGVSGVFVGRQREMEELRAALEESIAGRGRLVMLVGEPGIGKTRTAQELASHAEGCGAQVIWGRCYEEEGAPPYWPWVQPIRSYVQQRISERLRFEMGAGAADIAEIIPEVREKLPNLEPPPLLEPQQARFRLFDSITGFFKNAARNQPLLLVLDDLHWADEPSLLLLRFLAQQLAGSSILVSGCYRDVELSRQHPLSETLAWLAREQAFQRHLLRGLSREETGRLIEEIGAVSPSQSLVEKVFAHTEGNPYFMTELVRLLVREGDLEGVEIGGPQGLSIPEGVREVIGQRLNQLSERCNLALTTASVIGREFRLELLGRLIQDLSEDQLLEVVDEALAGRLIEELPQRAGQYQFSHMLTQETLSDELSLTRRVRLHARIGETLEELYGIRSEAHAAELAYHFARAETVAGTEKLVKYSLLAGEQALAAYAYEEALAYFQRALGCKEEQEVDAETAAALFGLARSQAATAERHQRNEASNTLRRAFDYYVETNDIDRALLVARTSATFHEATMLSGISARALELVPPDSHHAGQLLPGYLRILVQYQGQLERGLEVLDQALAIARREQDTALEMATLEIAAHAFFFQLHIQKALEYSLPVRELARQLNELGSEEHASWVAARALLMTGDLAGAGPLARTSLALAEQLRDRPRLAHALWLNSEVSILKGDWEIGRGFNNKALELVPRDPIPLSWRAVVEYETGDFSQGEAYLERLVESMSLESQQPRSGIPRFHSAPAIVIPMAARITGTVDRFEVASAAAETVLTIAAGRPYDVATANAGLALVAVQRGDTLAAKEQYPTLESQRGRLVSWMPLSTDRVLGLLSQTMGNLDQAASHFEDGLAFCRRAGYRPELAWTCCDYADDLLQRSSPRDREKARSLLDESLAISRELGMRPLVQRAAARLNQMEAQPAAAPAYPDRLTRREVEVLRLIAAGRSNQEIAGDLVLSIRTVERHVTNSYKKINAKGRADATAYTLRHNLAD